jgi:hypothetical protein
MEQTRRIAFSYYSMRKLFDRLNIKAILTGEKSPTPTLEGSLSRFATTFWLSGSLTEEQSQQSTQD